MTFAVPTAQNCGHVRVANVLEFVEGSRSDHRCHRPTFDINSAYTAADGGVYCANAIWRKVRWLSRQCLEDYTHRAVVMDQHGKPMRLSKPGDWWLCGSTSLEEGKEFGQAAKLLTQG